MRRKALLILLIVASIAVFVPSPSPAITIGRACVQTVTSGGERGCEFNAGGRRIHVAGVVADFGIARLDVWVTATDEPTDEPLVLCSGLPLPLASGCRRSARNPDLTGTLYCWASANGTGVFACAS